MFQGIELVCHFNKSYPVPAAGLLPRTPWNFATKPHFDKLQRTVINAPNILARLPNDPMVQPLYSTSMLHTSRSRISDPIERHYPRLCMWPRSSVVDAFWQAFRCYFGLDHDNYTVGSFGDYPDIATELADLAMAGIKRATASLAHDYEDGREPIPRLGEFVMMLHAEARPRSL